MFVDGELAAAELPFKSHGLLHCSRIDPVCAVREMMTMMNLGEQWSFGFSACKVVKARC
jgi:hypothetical protein